MKNIVTYIFVLSSLVAFSQDENQIPELENKSYYLLFDNTNLRNQPGLKSDVVQLLKLGTELKIDGKTTDTYTQNGITHYWYSVTVLDNTGKETPTKGYIWGGFLAEFMVESKDDPGIKFVFGLAKVTKKDDFPTTFYQIRVYKDNMELAKHEFQGVGSTSTSRTIDIFGNKGVKNITNILQITFSDGFCAGAFGDIFFFWDKAILHYVNTLYSGFDAPFFSEDKYTFPEDEGGKPNVIIFSSESGEHVDENKINYEKQEKKTMFWTGTELKIK